MRKSNSWSARTGLAGVSRTFSSGESPPGRRVLVGVASGEGFLAAGPLARVMARGQGGELLAFHGVTGEPGSREARELEERLRTLLEQEGVLDSPLGAKAFITRRTGWPAAAVLQTAVEENADLIVVTPYRKKASGRMLVGSVSEEVVHRSQRPVLSIPLGCRQAGHPRLRRILLFLGDAAIPPVLRQWTIDAARRQGGRVEILHVAPFPHQLAPRGQRPRMPSCSGWSNLEEKRRVKEQLVCSLPDDMLVTCVLQQGCATQEILDRAHLLDADLIIMGKETLWPHPGSFIGTRIERVLRRSASPVLVVPHTSCCARPGAKRVSRASGVLWRKTRS